jgi:hypothetical protein
MKFAFVFLSPGAMMFPRIVFLMIEVGMLVEEDGEVLLLSGVAHG